MRRSTRTSIKRVVPENDSSEEDVAIKKLKPQTKNKKTLKISSSSNSSNSSEDESIAIIQKKSKNLKSSSINKSLTTDNEISRNKEKTDSSSSESDIEDYLQPADEIDLSSTFFNVVKAPEKKTFECIESNIFDGININQPSDSESENDSKNEPQEPTPSTSTADFHQLHEYTQRLEEAKEAVEKYEANKKVLQAREKKERKKKKKTDEEKLDILNLLAQGESKPDPSGELLTSINSSDFESLSDSEREDWQEIENNTEIRKSIVPKEGVEVTVQLPGVTQKKKKEVDALASIKRRLNRVRKENQVLVHKVHLLCWIAHGNFVNKVLNSENLMALALSLLPSQHCYPADRTDLKYLEQIVKWYRSAIPIADKQYEQDMSLEHLLKLQLNLKKAYDKKMFVYIFICILRSLGIHCRLVLSFQVMPLRPPSSELHSLSTKNDKNKSPNIAKTDGLKDQKVNQENHNKEDKSKIKSLNANKEKSSGKVEKSATKSKEKVANKVEVKQVETLSKTRRRHVSTSSSSIKKNDSELSDKKPKTRSSSANEVTNAKKSARKSEGSKQSAEKDLGKPKLRNLLKVPQVDGPNDSEEELTPSQIKKPNLRKLSQRGIVKCSHKKHKDLESRLQDQDDSEDDFKPQSVKKSPNLMNLRKGQKSKSSGSTLKTDLRKTTDDTKKKENFKTSKMTSLKNEESELHNGPNGKKHEVSKLSNDNKRKLRSKSTVTNEESIKSSTIKKERSKSSNDKRETLKSRKLETTKRSSLTRIDYGSKSSKGLDIKNDIISIMKGRIAQEKEVERRKKVKNTKSRYSSDEDSDYVPIETKKKYDSDDEHYKENKVKVKQRVKPRKELEAMEEVKSKKGVDFWVEVYLEAEEKWIAADLIKGGVHCVSEIYARASHPVTYIVAWNNDSTIKDISQRYCPNWNTVTRTLRIDTKWWDETIKPFMGSKTTRDKEEDEELALFHLEKPLPKIVSEYKNHPLYALKRHLLKFEVFYPSNPVTLGFVRGEPVYSRECVKTVRSREKWYKEAKVVKQGEQPYKIVTRTTYDKYQRKFLQNQPLEVFGEWQVEDYVPPAAENGIVPKNEYGNVELFKECMIPKGTVHLQLPGLNKIARKMNIDCPAAMVGFDIHHGWTHPMFDGFIVCEEHVETLIAAWHLEREEQEVKEKEKLEKRVYDNWKKLIKGLLIRERLKKRYNFGENLEPEAGKSKKRKAKAPKFTCKKRRMPNGSDSDSKA